MAKTFLAGVANAEIFKNDDLFATAKTLIDSSITIGVSAEDVRAGQGAKLYGKYFHTSTFDLKLSDAMFRLEYIAANVGSEITLGGDVFAEESHIAATGGKVELNPDRPVVPMKEGGAKFIYWKKPEDAYYTTLRIVETEQGKNFDSATNTVTIAGITEGQEICVKYLYTNDMARKLNVSANFTPDTVSVYLTANLYSGDDQNPTTGTKIGTVTIKVPRFLLSGSQELSMSMTGASNTAFEGSALAAKGKGCDNDGIYAEIIEVINDRTGADISQIMIADSAKVIQMGKTETLELEVYGRFGDSAPVRLPADLLTVTAEGFSVNGLSITPTEGTTGPKTITVKVKAKETVTASVNVDVATE